MSAVWAALGWLGNACFFSRFLFQWAASERAGKSVAPPLFWWISLSGSTLLGAYSVHQARPILLVGFVLNGGIYARNLWMNRTGRGLGPAALWCFAAAGATLIVLTVVKGGRTDELPAAWIVCGVVGQAFWSSRFVLQLIASERQGRSHFPPVFWKVSLAGNALLLAYALRIGDPVYVAGLLPGPLVQIRNLMLGTGRDRNEPATEAEEDELVPHRPTYAQEDRSGAPALVERRAAVRHERTRR